MWCVYFFRNQDRSNVLKQNPSLRAVFLLLGYIGKLQLRCSDMEKEQQELQNQHITARQATLDAERKCIDIQRERLQDKEAARTHEKALRDQHQTEKTELQRCAYTLLCPTFVIAELLARSIRNTII